MSLDDAVEHALSLDTGSSARMRTERDQRLPGVTTPASVRQVSARARVAAGLEEERARELDDGGEIGSLREHRPT